MAKFDVLDQISDRIIPQVVQCSLLVAHLRGALLAGLASTR
jgi:hypothetical protein